MTMIYKQSDITSFTHLSNFKSLKDFNNNIEAFLASHGSDLSKKETILLKTLTRYSVKVLGVSNVSIRTLIKAVHKQGITVSEATFHRMKRKAIKLGIIEIIATERSDKSQSSNLYVFQPFINRMTSPYSTEVKSETRSKTSYSNDTELSASTKGKTPHKAEVPSKTNNMLNNRSHTREINESKLVSNRIPEQFKAVAAILNTDYKQIEDLWSAVQYQTYHLTSYSNADKVSLGLKGLYQLIRNMKLKTNIRKSVGAYYTGIIKRMLDAEYQEWLFAELESAGV
ncbi:hypothetical protein [Jeotgalibacillus malaysiensis]|uniref:hypothetical protein n=1 Tax=Jeotgalibacillus malaysiensis TaxID=1508404 RepID=UPI00384C7D9F